MHGSLITFFIISDVNRKNSSWKIQYKIRISSTNILDYIQGELLHGWNQGCGSGDKDLQGSTNNFAPGSGSRRE